MMIRRNYPASVAESQQMLETSEFGSYKIETIGDLLDRRPEPLPDSFMARLAASIAENPAAFGRLFLHAIRAAQEVQSG